MSQRFGWGHINVNVRDLDVSIRFYEKLGFEVFIPGIPYLGLNAERESLVHAEAAEALGIPQGTAGRACIMQLDNGFPKLDLTEYADSDQRSPLENQDFGLVRICLASQDLAADYQHLMATGVEFISAPTTCHQRMADIAICRDPDGTLIELIQIYPQRWA